MKIIRGGRATGKTYQLVRDAHANNGVIMVATIHNKRYIESIAKDIGIECPPIYLPRDFISGAYMELPKENRVAYIDELQFFLSVLTEYKLQIAEVVLEPETKEINMGATSQWIKR